jgi:hypothetical protein
MLPRLRLSDDKMLYRARVEDTDFQIWEKNRNVDGERVQEILTVFRNDHYQHVPGYITVFKKDNDYYIIDGSHRYSAAKEYTETNYRDTAMDVCVIEKITDDIIFKEFQNINKNVPPPEFLMNMEVNSDKRQLCENIVEWLSLDYKQHCMKTKKPRIPNFRKDDLTNTLYETIPNNNSTYENVKKQILELNKLTATEFKDKAIKKCEKSGFYILYDKEWTQKLRNRLIL